MTTNVPAKFEDISYEEILKLTGMPEARTAFLPALKINRDAEDDDGNTLPIGSYCVNVPSVGLVYAKSVNFRPYINAYQINHYDPVAETFVNRSIIFKNWKEEKIDALGGVACGKVPRKNLDQLTEAEKAIQKNIKTNRLLYGTVSFKGMLANKEPHTVENIPVLWKTTGVNFVPVQNALDIFSRKKLVALKFYLKLETEKQKKGSNTYYAAVITPNLSDVLPIGQNELETLKVFEGLIREENARVSEAHSAARKSSKASTIDMSVADMILADSQDLASDLNDDISDLGR